MTSVTDLENDLRRYNDAYTRGSTLISDDHYDRLVIELSELTKNKSPVLSEIGSLPSDTNAVALPYWVGSLDKVIGSAVTQKMAKCSTNSKLIVSDKLDGISCLYVRDGSIDALLTRGNGKIGQNITHMMPYLQDLPTDLFVGQNLIVRGELVIPKSVFATHFSTDFANMRNLVAGCVNSKIPKRETASKIVFVPYEIPSHSEYMKLSEQLRILKTSVTHTLVDATQVTYESLLSTYKDRKANGDFDIDGIVVAMDTTYTLQMNSNPVHAFAFKDPSLMELKTVEVTCVTWDVSRHGRLTPVVSFRPVPLAGVMVGRATGHNYNFVHEKGIGVGAVIVICRSGDVIPKITGVTKSSVVQPPDVPYRVEGPHAYRLEGIDPAKRLHFFLTSFDIKNAGPAACVKLYENGIMYPKDVINLSPEEMTRICGTKTGATVPQALKEAINAAPNWLLLSATGAFGAGIGERILRSVSDAYPSRPIETLTVSELCSVEGVGSSRAQQIASGIEAAIQYVAGLDREVVHEVRQATGRKLTGQRIIFTGVRDKDLTKLIEDQGGIIVTGGKKATILVVPSEQFKTSAKSNDAIQAGARVLTVARMHELLSF
jgi:NAD-dependent DNA ligase